MQAPLTLDERRRLVAQIGVSLCVLELVRVFWSPSQRRLFARSAFRADDLFRPCRGRGGALPPDAQLVGVYEHGCVRTADVLDDLIDAIVHPPEPARPQPSPPEPASVALPRCDVQAALAVAIPPALPFSRPINQHGAGGHYEGRRASWRLPPENQAFPARFK